MDLKQFINKNGKINSFYCQAGFLEKRGLLSDVMLLSSFLNNEYTLKERIVCLVNNITEAPVCVVCNKKTNFNTDKNAKTIFRQTCSTKCGAQLPKDFSKVDQKAAAIKRVKSMKEKYGFEYNNQRPDVKELVAEKSRQRIEVIAYEKLNDRVWLNEEYNNKQRSALDIAYQLGCDYATVIVYARKYNYKIRKHVNSSLFEKLIQEFLAENGINFIASSKEVISPLELDIYIPDYNLAIEFNGVYWHSENDTKPADKTKHLKKTEACDELGIQLLHINEEEWITKEAIWKSMILHRCKKSQTIYARKTTVKEVTNKDARLFLNANHLQGAINGKHLGLYYNDELIQIVSYGVNRFKNNSNELLRSCSKLNINVVGGFSKLLSHIPQKYLPLTSYCNRRYSNGNGYIQSGFVLDHISKPSYNWTKKNKILNRMSCQKHKLPKLLGEDFDPNLSEADNMFNCGYRRLWDCGNLVFIYDK